MSTVVRRADLPQWIDGSTNTGENRLGHSMKRLVALAAIPMSIIVLSAPSHAATVDVAAASATPSVASVGEPVTFTLTHPCTVACALTWRRPDLGLARFGGMIVGNGETITLTFPEPGRYRLVLDLSETCSGTTTLVCHSYADAIVDIVAPTPTPAPIPARSYTSLLPARLMDTRAGAQTTDGLFAGTGVRPAGSITELTVGSRGGVSSAPTTVVLNVTVTEPATSGFVTAFPCGMPPPNASNLNYAARQTIAGSVLAKVGVGSTVCLYSSAAAHLVVDVNGFMPDGTDYESVSPGRLFDTRPATSTADGQSAAIGGREAGTITRIAVAGRLGVPVGTDAVALNVTVTEPASSGFITVYPCDAPRPSASSVNFAAGQTITNTVLTRVDSSGDVCFYTSARTHMLSDLWGFFPASSSYVGVQPARLLDTRSGEPTIDGDFAGGGRRSAGSITELVVAGRAGVPATAAAVALNLTVTDAPKSGFISVFPCGGTRPAASTLNYAAGSTISNAAITAVGAGGRVCVFTSSETNLIVDVSGSFP